VGMGGGRTALCQWRLADGTACLIRPKVRCPNVGDGMCNTRPEMFCNPRDGVLPTAPVGTVRPATGQPASGRESVRMDGTAAPSRNSTFLF